MEQIQNRRKDKRIPATRKRVHEYVNLYFDAHNPMLSRLRSENDRICILRVSACVLDLEGVIVADRNVACGYVRFYDVARGLPALDGDKVFARYWTHPGDQYAERDHKSVKCAEVLIPGRVSTEYVLGVYVANETGFEAFSKVETGLTVEIRRDIFF